jgi:hypothetical protein
VRAEKGGEKAMRTKLAFLGLLIVVVALNIVPAYAKDYMGYVEATNYEWIGPIKQQSAVIQGGAAQWSMSIYALHNTGAFPLTNAIILGKIVQVMYIDSSGSIVTTTDTTVIAQYARIEKAKDMWQDGYVIKVGTVKPGASKHFFIKVWGAAGGVDITFDFSTWYLP